MLFLVFRLGGDRYVLEARQIVEVLPLVDLRALPRAPAGVAGLLSYHGAPVPVLDLARLALDRPAQQRLSTRIALVRYPDPAGVHHLLGLMIECVTDVMRREADDFSVSGGDACEVPWRGPLAADAQGLIQWLDLDGLLPASVRAALFA